MHQTWHTDTSIVVMTMFAGQYIFSQCVYPELLWSVGHRGVFGRLQFSVRQCSLLKNQCLILEWKKREIKEEN